MNTKIQHSYIGFRTVQDYMGEEDSEGQRRRASR